jgi:palmitoyl-protein thioesterase
VEDHDRQLIPLQNRTLYQQDWLGLKSLNDQGRLEFIVCPGQHVREIVVVVVVVVE